jgi:hypothetical protein
MPKRRNKAAKIRALLADNPDATAKEIIKDAGGAARPRHAGAGLQREIDDGQAEGGRVRIADPGEDDGRCAGWG